MIDIETSDPKRFREYLEVIATITEEPTLVFSPDGLTVDALDPSHASMINLTLPPGYFDSYHVAATEKFSVSLPKLLKGLGKINKNDYMFRLTYDYDTEIKEVASKNLIGQDTQETTLTQIKINENVVLTLISDINRVKTFPCLEPLEEELPSPRTR